MALLYAIPAGATVDASLEPHDIEMGEAAELTIKISGLQGQSVNLPTVPGLQFRVIGQSRSIQMTNGITLSSVVDDRTRNGDGARDLRDPGSHTTVATVDSARAAGRGARPLRHRRAARAAGPTCRATACACRRMGPPSCALGCPSTTCTSGESVPVDIEVGMRAGFVTSLNGLPTFKGGDFTLNNLSHQPERVERMVDGKPFEVFVWHSVLAAVKPGDFSLSVETPLTVRVRTQSQRESRLEDLLGDPFLQNIFGATVAKKTSRWRVRRRSSRSWRCQPRDARRILAAPSGCSRLRTSSRRARGWRVIP